jgi:hypothetical protein
MTGVQLQPVSLVGEKGRQALFTHLKRPAWERLVSYFGEKIDGDLYVAILYIRVIARHWQDARQVTSLAGRNPRLINRVFFDPNAYDGTPLQRLAAALAWAIATHRGEDPHKPSAKLKAVAFCLAEPMAGGELRIT